MNTRNYEQEALDVAEKHKFYRYDKPIVYTNGWVLEKTPPPEWVNTWRKYYEKGLVPTEQMASLLELLWLSDKKQAVEVTGSETSKDVLNLIFSHLLKASQETSAPAKVRTTSLLRAGLVKRKYGLKIVLSNDYFEEAVQRTCTDLWTDPWPGIDVVLQRLLQVWQKFFTPTKELLIAVVRAASAVPELATSWDLVEFAVDASDEQDRVELCSEADKTMRVVLARYVSDTNITQVPIQVAQKLYNVGLREEYEFWLKWSEKQDTTYHELTFDMELTNQTQQEAQDFLKSSEFLILAIFQTTRSPRDSEALKLRLAQIEDHLVYEIKTAVVGNNGLVKATLSSVEAHKRKNLNEDDLTQLMFTTELLFDASKKEKEMGQNDESLLVALGLPGHFAHRVATAHKLAYRNEFDLASLVLAPTCEGFSRWLLRTLDKPVSNIKDASRGISHSTMLTGLLNSIEECGGRQLAEDARWARMILCPDPFLDEDGVQHEVGFGFRNQVAHDLSPLGNDRAVFMAMFSALVSLMLAGLLEVRSRQQKASLDPRCEVREWFSFEVQEWSGIQRQGRRWSGHHLLNK